MVSTPNVVREQPRSSGFRGVVGSWLLARSERRYARQASQELLELYRTVSAGRPDLAEKDIYRLVVQMRTGCDAATADDVLRCAQESFAQWPEERDLTLCDVVHYLSVTEFLAAHEGANWVHSNFAHVVAERIPPKLCIARRVG